MSKKIKRKKLKKKGFFLSRSWWVLLFLVTCYIAYDQAVKRKNQEVFQLQSRLNELIKLKATALSEKEDLLLRIYSQSDPEWIELILMKELGVVPSGFLKVHFQKD